MLQGEAELAPRLVQEPEVEVAAQVTGAHLDRLAELQFRLRQEPGLEEDESQVRAEHFRTGIVREQGARRVGRLVVVPALEFEEGEKVQDVFVVGTDAAGLVELFPGVLEAALAYAAARPIQVKEKEALIDGGRVAGRGLQSRPWRAATRRDGARVPSSSG